VTERAPLALIVALSRNRCIGRDGTLPWHLPEDLAHFRRTTLGHAVIMGRRTWDSVGRPLKKRRNIVVTRREFPQTPGVEAALTVEAAVEMARQTDPMPFIIGGAVIYEAALPWTTRIYMTRVDWDAEGDTFFPALPEDGWREVEARAGETPGVTFVTLERI